MKFLDESGEGKHPDVLLDEEVCDFKRIESGNKSKIYQRLEESRQAKFYVVDLRISRISDDDAVIVARHAVDSDRIMANRVILLFADDHEELIE